MRFHPACLLVAAFSALLISAKTSSGHTFAVHSPPTPMSSGSPGSLGSPAQGQGLPWHLRVDGRNLSCESISFALPTNASLHPKLKTSAVRWSGSIAIPDEARYRFHVELEGHQSFTLKLAGASEVKQWSADGSDPSMGKLTTEWLQLSAGDLAVQAEWQRDGSSAARVRFLWEREHTDDRGFRPEPLPRDVLRLPPGGLSPTVVSEISTQELQREGRQLFGQLGCANCHTPVGANPAAKANAPHAQRGPNLDGVGQRLDGAWLRKWIADPQAVKSGSSMPDLFGDSDSENTDLQHLLAFLAQQSSAEKSITPAAVATEPEVLARGAELYHQVGCVVCHAPFQTPADLYDNPEAPDRLPRAQVPAPLRSLEGKWQPSALARFLEEPSAHWPDSPMPSMNLTAEEADLIATYLLSVVQPATQPLESAGDLEVGARVFVERGCVQCHEHSALSIRASSFASSIKGNGFGPDSSRGCFGPPVARRSDRPMHANYDLAPQQQEALAAFLDAEAQPDEAHAPIEQARARFESLSCQACHQRNDWSGSGSALRPYFLCLDESSELGDEGRVPPSLDGVGAKLSSSWIRQVLSDSGQARPYMGMRMPQFGDRIEGLADGLALWDATWPDSDSIWPEPTNGRIQVGKRMMGNQGLACISCHVVGDRPPAGTAGPDMTQFAERLRYEWFRDYMHAPARFKPGTRMPQFTTNGESAFTNIYDGDAEQQVDAMWSYFSLGEFLPVPDGVPSPNGMLLAVDERPRIHRTFLESVGTRAICVGFPSGLHYAFDAESAGLAEVWQGNFIDASANWSARGGGHSGGRGPLLWQRTTAPAFLLASPSAGEEQIAFQKLEDGADASGDSRLGNVRFRGYQVGEDGGPTFLYDVFHVNAEGVRGRSVSVQETIVPYPREGILFGRLLAVSGLQSDDAFWIPNGSTAQQSDSQPYLATPIVNAELIDIPGRGTVGVRAKDPNLELVLSLEVAQ